EADIVDDAAQLIDRNDLVDRFADPVSELGSFLDTGACLRSYMDLDLATVDAREEVLAEIGGEREREREQGEAHEPGDHLDAIVQAKVEQAAIGAANG